MSKFSITSVMRSAVSDYIAQWRILVCVGVCVFALAGAVIFIAHKIDTFFVLSKSGSISAEPPIVTGLRMCFEKFGLSAAHLTPVGVFMVLLSLILLFLLAQLLIFVFSIIAMRIAQKRPVSFSDTIAVIKRSFESFFVAAIVYLGIARICTKLLTVYDANDTSKLVDALPFLQRSILVLVPLIALVWLVRFTIKNYLYFLCIVDKEDGVILSFKRSQHLTRGSIIRMLFLALLEALFHACVFAGTNFFVASAVLALVLVPLFFLTQAHLYYELVANRPAYIEPQTEDQ